LEALFRLAASVQGAVRLASTSPRRADVVAMGADGSPTESLDRVAELQLISFLEAEGLDWNLLSEEAGAVDRGGTRTLVVDPIDGSHNALHGLPFATVSMALGNGTLEGVDVGVVHDLATGSTYWASRGGGAFRDGHRIRTRPWEIRRELFFINLGRHATPRAVALAGRGRRVRALGCASLEMAMVAHGGADAYLFENQHPDQNLRVTDIAASYRIVAEAGGGVADASGNSLAEFPLELHRHTSVLAFGDPRFAAAVWDRGSA
jgi:fructose-1,6-bisphosphatase/inositol monophosphatase family enzyme